MALEGDPSLRAVWSGGHGPNFLGVAGGGCLPVSLRLGTGLGVFVYIHGTIPGPGTPRWRLKLDQSLGCLLEALPQHHTNILTNPGFRLPDIRSVMDIAGSPRTGPQQAIMHIVDSYFHSCLQKC